MQLLSFDSRYFAKFARPQLRCHPDLVAIRERLVNNSRGDRGTLKSPSTPGMSSENVPLGATGRKHFRNPREFLSRLAKGQATRFLRLINRFPITERY